MKSYDYKNRKGVKELSWDNFHQICKELTQRLPTKDIDIILGVARGGLYPATLISGMLRKEFYPLRISRRINDKVEYKNPKWKVDVTDDIKDKKVLIIDDIADNGQTLQIVAQRASEKGAKSIKTLTLVTHSWANPKPDYYGIESDELIIFPWDTKIMIDGIWQLHPELGKAIKMQK